MKKKYLWLTVVFMLMFALAGCGNNIGEKQLKSDLETYSEFNFLGNEETITDTKIEKKELSENKDKETIWATVTTKDSEKECKKGVTIVYTKNRKNEWGLNKVNVDEQSKWIIVPIKGKNEETIIPSLNGRTVTVDGEQWTITESAIKDFKVEKHETDLEGKKDTVTFSLTLNDVVEEAKGTLTVDYKFDRDWIVDTVSGDSSFKAEEKTGMALNVTDEDLIKVIDKQTFQIGIPKNESASIIFYSQSDIQEIKIESENIEQFSIDNQKTSEKGTWKEFDCSMLLKKNCVTFKLSAKIQYKYIDSWQIQPFTFEHEVDSLNIIGEWKGTYNKAGGGGEVTIKITDCTDDGEVVGEYSWTPYTVWDYDQPGSYKLSGTLDKETMALNFVAGDWIIKPKHTIISTKHGVNGIINIEENQYYAGGHENSAIKLTLK